MRYLLAIFFIIVLGADMKGQTGPGIIQGKVSFISSQNIYVKFTSTAGILVGDTLFVSSGGNLVPVLRVNNLSSVSCVCSSLSSESLPVDHLIIAKPRITETKIVNTLPESKPDKPDTKVKIAPVSSSKEILLPVEGQQKIRGYISAYSYSDFSNTTAKNTTRLRYTFSLDARNIGGSKFSFENYMSFRHTLGAWGEVKGNLFNALKIYSLAVKYQPDKTTMISLGRTINPNISSIGSVDGLQAEKSFKNLSLGAVVGSRPDFTDWGFNGKLLQYGAYIAYNSVKSESYNQTSFAFIQQSNNFKTDRRFLYFQHTDALIKNVYFFSSFEADLYKLTNNIPQSTFDLTSLYLSLRFTVTKRFALTGSYDARKNTIYYESFKTVIDQVIEKEMRQNYRLRADYHITDRIMLGVESGYRFLKSDHHPSKNAYGYLTYSQIPGLNMSLTITGTYLESNYLNGKIAGATLSRDLFKGKLQTELGYRYVDYIATDSQVKTLQNTGEMNLYWQLSSELSLSVNYEAVFEKQERFNRVYLQIRKRF